METVERLYVNVGGKIMKYGKILGYINLAAAALALVYAFFAMLDDGELALIVALAAVGGAVTGVVTSWLIYGFGQIVSDIHNIKLTAANENMDSDLILPKL